MARVPAYHSTSPEDRYVYHIYDNCPTGEQIHHDNWAKGKDGRDRCDQCSRKKDKGRF